jgi:hypothetical protein
MDAITGDCRRSDQEGASGGYLMAPAVRPET